MKTNALTIIVTGVCLLTGLCLFMNSYASSGRNAFTDEPFKGNPAGVMIVDELTTAGWMQNMASEMNLSETVFIIPKGSGFAIRYFTPAQEVRLCGHATLAGFRSKAKPLISLKPD